jgi:hypothetical protein
VEELINSGRLATLERRIARLTRMLWVCLSLLIAVGALGVTAFAGGDRSGGFAPGDSLRVRDLAIVDANGTIRARLSGDLPDAVTRTGRRMPRGDQAAGMLIYDNVGVERGGYVTFNRSGTAALTLDTRGPQALLIAADTTDGAAARVWLGSSWAEMKADGGGPHFSAGRNGEVVFSEPPATPAESKLVCTDFKAELARITPPPPDSLVLAACKQHLSDRECHLCLGKP